MELFWMLVKAFVAGGLLCAVGQIFIDYTTWTPARILTGYVVAGVILGALGLYDGLRDMVGAGASVPLLGFGNTLVTGVREALGEEGLLGALTGGFTASAAGIAAAIVFSLAAAAVFRSRSNLTIAKKQ